jgi:hypothetical protein
MGVKSTLPRPRDRSERSSDDMKMHKFFLMNKQVECGQQCKKISKSEPRAERSDSKIATKCDRHEGQRGFSFLIFKERSGLVCCCGVDWAFDIEEWVWLVASAPSPSRSGKSIKVHSSLAKLDYFVETFPRQFEEPSEGELSGASDELCCPGQPPHSKRTRPRARLIKTLVK